MQWPAKVVAQRCLPHTVLCVPLAGHIVQYVGEMGIIEGRHQFWCVWSQYRRRYSMFSTARLFSFFPSFFFSLVLFQMTGSHSTGKAQFSISYRLFKQSFPRGTSNLNSWWWQEGLMWFTASSFTTQSVASSQHLKEIHKSTWLLGT